VHGVPAPANVRSIESDLDHFLDAAVAATEIFRVAVAAYLSGGQKGHAWQLARQIDEQLRTVDDLQQRFETGMRRQHVVGGTFPELLEPLAGVTRLLRDMRRQISGFAVESGFSGAASEVSVHLVADLQQLTEEVCSAVDELIEDCRPCVLLWNPPASADAALGVGWYESRADRLSTRLIKQILQDDALGFEAQLRVARLVEEIDRLADYAENVCVEVRVGRMIRPTVLASADSR